MSDIVTPEPGDWPDIIKRQWESSRELEVALKNTPVGDALFSPRGRGHEQQCPAASQLGRLLAAYDLADPEQLGTACDVTLAVGESYRLHLRKLIHGSEPDLASVLGVLEDRLRAAGWSPPSRVCREAPVVVFRSAVAAIVHARGVAQRRAEVTSSALRDEVGLRGTDSVSPAVTAERPHKPRPSRKHTCEGIMLHMLGEAHAGQGDAGIEEMTAWESPRWFEEVNKRAARPYADARSVRKTGLWTKILKPLGEAQRDPAARSEATVSHLESALRQLIENKLPDADTALAAADQRRAAIDDAVAKSQGDEREQELRYKAARNRRGEDRVPPQEFAAAPR